MAGVKAEELDMIICNTISPDQPLPSTSCFIQTALGAKNCAAFDLSAACSGFLFGLCTAEQFIITGKYKKILVIGVELLSRWVDWQDRTTCIIFADGAGAAVVIPSENERGIIASSIHTDGNFADYLYIPAGGTKFVSSHKTIDERLHYIKMRGNELFKVAIRYMESVAREVLESANVKIEDIDLFIPHQANQRISVAVAERLNVPMNKVYSNIDRIGNTSSASIPIALDEVNRANKIKEGDLILLASFGAGVTYAGTIIRW